MKSEEYTIYSEKIAMEKYIQYAEEFNLLKQLSSNTSNSMQI